MPGVFFYSDGFCKNRQRMGTDPEILGVDKRICLH